MKSLVRSISPFIVPVCLLLLTITFFGKVDEIPSSVAWVVYYVPYVVLTAAAILSYWFKRSRVFFIIIVLGTCQFMATTQIILSVKSDLNLNDIISAIWLLIPMNILAFSFMKERGILSLWGFLKLGFIIFQISFVLWSWTTGNNELFEIINYEVIPSRDGATAVIPHLAIIVFIVAFAVQFARYVLYRLYLDASFMGALIALGIGLYMQDNPLAMPVYFSIAGIILLTAVIQDSYKMAFMDELTGLPSRRALRHELMKLSGKYVIAMLDIDFFKKFNDTYGHDVGDDVLRMVATCIRDVTGGGKPFRYGGEEFTVLFPGKSLSDAVPHLEDLREAVSQRGFTPKSGKEGQKKKTKQARAKAGGGKQLFVTISIGVAEKNDKRKYPDDVIKAADTALYRAKKKGRNCVSR